MPWQGPQADVGGTDAAVASGIFIIEQTLQRSRYRAVAPIVKFAQRFRVGETCAEIAKIEFNFLLTIKTA
jgi:hypothetical protein